jgi:hypothetical protein
MTAASSSLLRAISLRVRLMPRSAFDAMNHAWHLALCHSPQALIATLAHAVLREDTGFMHIRCWRRESGNSAREAMRMGRHILIAVDRYLAAHSPTERASLQTADIARLLMQGGELH